MRIRRRYPLAVIGGLILVAVAAGNPKEKAGCAAVAERDRAYCQSLLDRYPEELRQAQAGEYQAQRNVAYVLSGGGTPGWPRPVPVDQQEGCAWRLVIVRLGHRQADDSDRRNLDLDCGRGGVDRGRAEQRAAELARGMRPAPGPKPATPLKELPAHCQEVIARNSVARPLGAPSPPLEQVPADCR